MAISRIPQRMQALAEAVLDMSEKVRAIRNGTGELRIRYLEGMQGAFIAAGAAAEAVLAEVGDGSDGRGALAASEMARHGFNGGPADLVAALTSLDVAGTAVNDAIKTMLHALPSGVLIDMPDNGGRRRIVRLDTIPAAQADEFRGQGELDALVAALVQVGA